MQAHAQAQAACNKRSWAGSPSIRKSYRAPGQCHAGRAGLLSGPHTSPVVVRATATKGEYLQYLPSALNLAGAAFSAYCQPEGDKTTGKDQVFWFSDWPAGAVVTWPSSSAPAQIHCDTRPQDELKTIREWQEQADLARDAVPTEAGAALKDLKPLAYVEVGRTDTQFWLYADLTERTIVIAFRGTSDDEDKITDARLLLVKGWKGTDANVWMHRGFKNGYVSARPLLHALLDAVMAQDKEPWQIYCTGHSLGGALASLAAFDLALTTEWGDHAAPSVSLHTFGSPRVGNGRFRDLLTAKLKSSWRWANQGDPVTRVPFFVYRHARTKVEISPDGVLTEDVAEEKKNVGILATIWDAVDDLIDDDDDEIPKGAVVQKLNEDQKTVPESDTDYNTVILALNDVNRSEAKSRAPAPVARAVATGAIPALSLGAVVAPHLQPAYFSNFKAAVAALKPQPTGPMAWAADKLSKLGKSLQGFGQGKKPQGPAGEVA